MQLVYLDQANRDIDRLYKFLINNNASLQSADKAILAIKEGAISLLDNSELGTDLNDGTERRELSIPFGKSNYVLRYFIEHEYKKILVLRIWHSREDRE